jgi:hypothetical protein
MNRKERIFFVAKLVLGIMLLTFAMLIVWQIVRLAILDYFFDIGFNVVVWLSLKISLILKMTAFYGALALLSCLPYLLKKNTTPDQNTSTEP